MRLVIAVLIVFALGLIFGACLPQARIHRLEARNQALKAVISDLRVQNYGFKTANESSGRLNELLKKQLAEMRSQRDMAVRWLDPTFGRVPIK